MPELPRKPRPTPQAPRTKAAPTAVSLREGFAPITDFDWSYAVSVVGDGPEADALRTFFAGFTTLLAPFTGASCHVLAPDDLDTAVRSFKRDIPVLYPSDVWAAAGRDDSAERRHARLERVLAATSARQRGEVEMLLATWPATQQPEVANVRATEAIAAWPGKFLCGGVRAEALAAQGRWEAVRPWVRTEASAALEAGRARGLLDPADTLYARPAAVVANRAALERARDLSLRGLPTREEWAVLRTAPRVERLALGANTVKPQRGLEPAAWWDGPLGAGLRTLELQGIRLTAKELGVFGGHGDTLRHLRLERADLAGAPAGEGLAQIAARHPLRSLDITANDIGPAGAKALLAAPVFASLRALDLTGNEVGDGGALALAHNPSLRALRGLVAPSNPTQAERWTAAAGEALAGADLPALQHLVLAGQGMGSEGAAALLASSRLAGLRALNLASCDADWAEVIDRCKGREGPALTALDVCHWTAKKKPRWGDAGLLSTVKHLRVVGLPGDALAGLLTSGCLGSLEVLVLGHICAEEHAKAVKEVPALPRLKVLSLEGWKLDEASAKALADAPFLAGLEGVDLGPGSDTPPGAARVFLARGIRLLHGSLFDKWGAASHRRMDWWDYERLGA